MIKPGKRALSHFMCIQHNCCSASTLRRHLCSIRMPLVSRTITPRILLKHPVCPACMCVCVWGVTVHVYCICVGEEEGYQAKLLCFNQLRL